MYQPDIHSKSVCYIGSVLEDSKASEAGRHAHMLQGQLKMSAEEHPDLHAGGLSASGHMDPVLHTTGPASLPACRASQVCQYQQAC